MTGLPAICCLLAFIGNMFVLISIVHPIIVEVPEVIREILAVIRAIPRRISDIPYGIREMLPDI